PCVSVRPPRSWPLKEVLHVLPSRELYAGVSLPCADAEEASPECIVPVIVPGGKPVGEMPGLLTPRSPLMAVPPVLVTAEAPRTTYDFAELSDGAVGLTPAFELDPLAPVTLLAPTARTTTAATRRMPVSPTELRLR